MAFSTFVFDTLDVCARLARYIFQELTGWQTWVGGAVGTIIIIVLPVYFILFSPEGSWVRFWTLFGSANQLLAALTLLTVSMWLHHSRRRIAFTLLPMLFVLVITTWSLTKLASASLAGAKGFDTTLINGLFSLTLMVLAIYLVISALIRNRIDHKNATAT